MKTQKLTHKRLLERMNYDPETGLFMFKTHRCSNLVGKAAGSLMSHGYVEIQVDGHRFTGHRLAWFYVTGQWPEHTIDHRDGNRSNNRFSNLRPATQAQNVSNKAIQSNNRSGVQGVVWDSRRGLWRAYVNKNGKHHHIGRFGTIEDAKKARQAASMKIHGDFAPEMRP